MLALVLACLLLPALARSLPCDFGALLTGELFGP
jgi:hypothetical protein